MAARKRKSRPSYTASMTIRMPGVPGDDGTDLSLSGPLDNELGRTLWLIVAACGGLLGPDIDVGDEVDALRLALERYVPAGNRAEIGRLASDAEALETKP